LTHHIEPGLLRKAAEQLLVIDAAGYGMQFERELFERTDGDRDFHLRRVHQGANRRNCLNAIDSFAKRLAKVMDCPLEQARGVAIDLLGAGERREVAIGLLSEMHVSVRRLQSQTQRPRRAG
jgi:hypothetical protein